MDVVIVILLIAIVILQLIIILKQKGALDIERPLRNLSLNLEDRINNVIKDEMGRNREEINKNLSQNRMELLQSIKSLTDSLNTQITNIGNMQNRQLEVVSSQLIDFLKKNQDGLDKIRQSVEEKLTQIQNDNNKKLEEMRQTVDEKLHSTLENRLSQSFKNISERLEALYKQLGEIQSLTTGVNDLKRALTNVKVRGIWGEVQLANIISEILTKEQYEENVATKKGSSDRVEFAVKLPGKDDLNRCVYLPIDAKFPQEDYQRLLDAQEEGNKEGVDFARKQLENRIKQEAKSIFEKYIDPPNTTDFAIMFLPTESLFAEVIRDVGLIETLQREYKVIVTGPTTILALLNSLQMGFRTLAIEKRSSEVWALLGAVKTEFTKFGDILEKTQKKLQEASNTIETAAKKTKTIERKLKSVQELPIEESERILIEDEER
ncbi:MAG: recombination protein RmuC [Caloramator sp.]|jgi:DNA recombination protein RmuC|uniref:DNA recombination protein RmuC n=1 Tax=Caloramator sp. TaxID=1871330 RepID=UPI001DA57272|nr:DNA recombination protein RmuC [Caloramator sp.]MBZ4662489.1 recombination protein RmuC [Caloramator sp.]